VKLSIAAVFAFIAVGWPLIIYTTGITGWLKYWFMPWLGYHFWVIFILTSRHFDHWKCNSLSHCFLNVSKLQTHPRVSLLLVILVIESIFQ